jgi:hypothetical protein
MEINAFGIPAVATWTRQLISLELATTEFGAQTDNEMSETSFTIAASLMRNAMRKVSSMATSELLP